MIEINIDSAGASSFKQTLEKFPELLAMAQKSAMRSVSDELRKRYAKYAKTAPYGPYAPLTIALRKGFGGTGKRGFASGSGYGPWIAAFTRYHVEQDGSKVIGKVGLLSKSDISGTFRGKGGPISASFAASAKRHAKGYDISVTRKRQRALGALLMRRYGKDEEFIHRLIPRQGTHRVKPRPVAEPVLAANKRWIIHSFLKLVKIKLAGGEYSRDWARG